VNYMRSDPALAVSDTIVVMVPALKLSFSAVKAIMPAKPIMTSQANPGYQKQIWRVGDHKVRLDAAEHALDVRRDSAVAAEETMLPEQPQVARPRHRMRGRRRCRRAPGSSAPLLQARRKLGDLSLGVRPGVLRIRDQPVDRPALDLIRRPHFPLSRARASCAHAIGGKLSAGLAIGQAARHNRHLGERP
jgi:hypothetical protein